MTRPKLSVILPNYNHSRYLPLCLQSILDQSWPADEIIVVDDASTDHTAEIARLFARRDAVAGFEAARSKATGNPIIKRRTTSHRFGYYWGFPISRTCTKCGARL